MATTSERQVLSLWRTRVVFGGYLFALRDAAFDVFIRVVLWFFRRCGR